MKKNKNNNNNKNNNKKEKQPRESKSDLLSGKLSFLENTVKEPQAFQESGFPHFSNEAVYNRPLPKFKQTNTC